MEPNTQLGNYALGDRLGQGAMADVFMAIQPGVDRNVAIKVMHPHLAGRDEFHERFQREARAMGRLQHPHIARVIDFDSDSGHAYMVMEYLAGGSLDEYLDALDGPMPIPEAVAIARQLADALQYAHAAGMVHRDLKPANVMFTDESHRHAVLTDFGIARLADASMTATGIMLGTPAYMAPEQARGERAEAAADQYSLGVMLHEMVTGVQPFASDSVPGLIMSHLNDPVPSSRVRNPSVSAELDAVIARAMAKQPHERFADAGELRAALEAAVAPATSGSATVKGTTVAVPAASAPEVQPGSLPPTMVEQPTPTVPPGAAPQPVAAAPLAHAAPPSAHAGGPSSNRMPMLIGGAVVALLVLVVGIFALTRSGGDDADGDVADAAAEEQAEVADPEGDADEDAIFAPTAAPDAEADDQAAAGPGNDEQVTEDEEGTAGEQGADQSPVAQPFTPSFDLADPPQMFVTGASLDDGRLLVAFDRALQPSEGTRYLAWVDTVQGPVGEVLVGDRGLARLDADVSGPVPSTFRISEEPAGTPPAQPGGRIVYSAGIEASAETRSEALDVAGALSAAERELGLAQEHTQLLRDAIVIDDLGEVRRHAEHVVNILSGADGPDFGDLDGSGVVENPGDDIGVRGHLETVLAAADAIRSAGGTRLLGAVGDGLALLPGTQRSYLRVNAADSVGEVDVDEGSMRLDEIEAALARARTAQGALVAIFLVTDQPLTAPGSIGLAPSGDATVASFSSAEGLTIDFGDFGPASGPLDQFGTLVSSVTVDQWAGLADAVVVTEGVSGPVATAALAPEGLEVVQALLLGDDAVMSLLGEQAQLAIDHVDLMQRSLDVADLGEARRHAEHVVNIVEGAEGAQFGDLDGNGVAENPGDDIGVLVYLDQVDALIGTLPVESDVMAFHVLRMQQAVDGVRDQAVQVANRTVRVLAADSIVEAQPFVIEAFVSGVLMLDGSDRDRNGVVDLFAGEAGVRGLTRQAPMLYSGAFVPADGD